MISDQTAAIFGAHRKGEGRIRAHISYAAFVVIKDFVFLIEDPVIACLALRLLHKTLLPFVIPYEEGK